MQNMRECIRIEQMLRGVAAAPCLVDVDCKIARFAPPNTALAAEHEHHNRNDSNACDQRPQTGRRNAFIFFFAHIPQRLS